MKINENLSKLINDNSFYKATTLIKEYKENHQKNKIVSLGIGDVSFPISKIVAKRMMDAVSKEASQFYVGYGNSYGIPELRKAIKENEYPDFSVEEIYVSQGTKTDATDLLELFAEDAVIGIPNPTYPIYENGCLSLNRKYQIIKCDEDCNPIVPDKHFDVVYLCSPNNPTGLNMTNNQLQKWVDYANKENCVIIYDNVYFRFIQHGVKSIYEIEGAKRCAIELRSFSKHASFTGLRCSYYVIPHQLHMNVNELWRLRTINRFNGASYVTQIGALATYDKKVQKEINKNVKSYLENADYIRTSFEKMGFKVSGGVNSPYVWVKLKKDFTSWQVFGLYLNMLEVIVVPGIIFGQVGDDHIRLSALGKKKDIRTAVARIKKYEQKNK